CGFSDSHNCRNFDLKVFWSLGLLMVLTLTASLPAFAAGISEDPTYGLQYCADKEDLSLSDLQPQPEDEATKHEKSQYFPANYGPALTAVVAHGLNLRPSKMADITSALKTLGAEVYQVGLPGHRGFLADDGSDPYTAWMGHLRATLCLASQSARSKSIPLVLVGFSLSGALYLDILGQKTEPIFKVDSMVLFAPAISLRFYSYFVKAFFLFGDEYYLNSWSPATYRWLPGAKMKHYQALFRTIDSLHHHAGPDYNIPTLVIIDPKDELVSPSGIKSFVDKHKLSNWQIKEISNKESTLKDKIHHLVISEEAVGPSTWKQIRRDFLTHLYQTTGLGDPPLPPGF
ncbi:MAG: hypothetical protein KDD43_16870, partial [Bdellovibrionales bacterium]|nr:hypothetical protein [Bdellovibrionales bacterium]